MLGGSSSDDAARTSGWRNCIKMGLGSKSITVKPLPGIAYLSRKATYPLCMVLAYGITEMEMKPQEALAWRNFGGVSTVRRYVPSQLELAQLYVAGEEKNRSLALKYSRGAALYPVRFSWTAKGDCLRE